MFYYLIRNRSHDEMQRAPSIYAAVRSVRPCAVSRLVGNCGIMSAMPCRLCHLCAPSIYRLLCTYHYFESHYALRQQALGHVTIRLAVEDQKAREEGPRAQPRPLLDRHTDPDFRRRPDLAQ